MQEYWLPIQDTNGTVCEWNKRISHQMVREDDDDGGGGGDGV